MLKVSLVLILLAIICFILFGGPKNQAAYKQGYKPRLLPGIYRYDKFSQLEMLHLKLFKNALSSIGDTLMLNEDSTYRFSHCGTAHMGRWIVQNDSLLLFCQSNRFKNDDENKVRGPLPCGTSPSVIQIINSNILYDERLLKGSKNIFDQMPRIVCQLKRESE